MLLDDRELVVVERPGLLQDRVRDRELADVVQQTADREAAQARGREAELLADLDRERGDAAGVLLGRRVLLGEAHHERAHAGAEERLLGGDDLAGAEVPDERARLAAAAQVVGDGTADERDAEQFEDVAEPPAEIHEGEHERAVERGGEQHEPEHDREVGGAAGEQEGVGGADGERAEERQADGEQQPRGRRSRGRHARHEPGLEHADDADDDDRHGERTLERDHVGDRRGEFNGAQRRRARAQPRRRAASRRRSAR